MNHTALLEELDAPKLTPCLGCGNEVDTEWCWCGDRIRDHGFLDNHAAVPMGCTYHYDNPLDPEEAL